jgi:thiamine pyrophosphate-dependent acetolactate synthase large subunit-like protein
MEIETACRHNLPIKIVVLNNGGIGRGVESFVEGEQIPAHALSIDARYDKMMEAFGGKGFFVEDPADLKQALEDAKAFDGPALVNVRLHHAAGRKPQQFGWLTT